LEKAIATVILTVAGITAIVAVLNALMPAISRTNGSLVASADSLDSRISTQFEIIHAAGVDGSASVDTWTKNVGSVAIEPIDRVDVFFGTADNFLRIPYGGPSCTAPCWSYTIENDTVWNPTATLKVTLTLDYTLSAGNTYYIKIVAPNGINDARFFTV
jgi:archaellum component FlaG (FlaF/FlaG flagellin family)